MHGEFLSAPDLQRIFQEHKKIDKISLCLLGDRRTIYSHGIMSDSEALFSWYAAPVPFQNFIATAQGAKQQAGSGRQ